MYRNNSYEERISRNLLSLSYAQTYFMGLLEDHEEDPGLPLEKALQVAIQRMGVAEFCAKTGLSKQTVNSFIHGRRTLKPETLDRYLKPFGLKTELTVKRIPLPQKRTRKKAL